MYLAQGYNTANSQSGVRHSTTRPPRLPQNSLDFLPCSGRRLKAMLNPLTYTEKNLDIIKPVRRLTTSSLASGVPISSSWKSRYATVPSLEQHINSVPFRPLKAKKQPSIFTAPFFTKKKNEKEYHFLSIEVKIVKPE